MKKLILIDGNAIIHRAFHALPPFMTMDGELVNAVYGFASMLITILNNEKPDYIAVSFDTAAKTFRHEEYKEYKATRVKAPDELYGQIPRIKELVQKFNIPICEIDGFEADDVLGTISQKMESEPEVKTFIVTGDRDTFQLVTNKTNVMCPVKGFQKYEVFDPQKVEEKYALRPDQIVDLKGLQGDSSDNIKGVAGIGQKTAQALLQKYQTIENIYKNLDELKGAVKEKLKNGEQDAYFSKKMATIITNVPISFELEKCRTHEYEESDIKDFLNGLGFKSLISRVDKLHHYYSKQKSPKKTLQAKLF